MQLISIACFAQDVWIRVTGRGNFKCSGTLKQLVQEMIGKGYYRYVLDLKECEQLDSTFMGTMTGIAQRLRQYPQATFKVVNVCKSNQELLENLGLDQLFLIQPLAVKHELPSNNHADCFLKSLSNSVDEKEKIKEIVVAAHEALVCVNQKNAEKFKNVFEVCTRRESKLLGNKEDF